MSTRELVFPCGMLEEVHAVTLAELSGGDIFCSWFAGSREGNPDITIWCSVRHDGIWAPPWQIATHDTYACYNPVAFALEDGRLLLFYRVGPNPREWWSYVIISADDGQTWSSPARLNRALGPIKNKPVLLDDGTLLCPSSIETETEWTAVMERISLSKLVDNPGSAEWHLSTVPLTFDHPCDLIQPTVLTHNNELQLLMRSKQGYIYTSWSRDRGITWSEAEPLTLLNPNSGIDAVTLTDGRHLLVYNPTRPRAGAWGGERTPLLAALSDDGLVWQDVATLEDQPGRYSYPAVIQGRDDTIHIAYTYDRKSIAVVDFGVDEL